MSKFWVKEKSTALYQATLKDHAGDAIAGSVLTTMTLTLYDEATGDIINSKNGTNVKNANGVTISEAGALAWIMESDDNSIVTSTSVVEHHVALFQWTWSSGKKGKHEVDIFVENLTKIT